MDPTRRAVLVVGAAGLTAGCLGRDRERPAPDPDVALRAAALATETALLAACRRLMTQPALAARLAVLAAHHAEHVAELGGGTPPASSVRTLAQLVALERAAATEHGRAALTASRALAPLLASLSAAASCAVAVL